jgi:phospholipid transport system transporter-binding protein
MAAATLETQSPGHYLLNGELSFATVTTLLLQSRPLFAGESVLEMDLSGVTHADSAGLSLLIEWLRQAKLQGKQLRYRSLPSQLSALASISDVDGLLSQSA